MYNYLITNINLNRKHKYLHKHLDYIQTLPYICNVFFMVLDLRLTKRIGCRETTNSCFIGVAHEEVPLVFY